MSDVLIYDTRARSLLLHPMRSALLTAIDAHDEPWTGEEAAKLTAEAYGHLVFTAQDGDLHVRSPRI